jgi:phosphohistidine swiveling domain-containing protein
LIVDAERAFDLMCQINKAYGLLDTAYTDGAFDQKETMPSALVLIEEYKNKIRERYSALFFVSEGEGFLSFLSAVARARNIQVDDLCWCLRSEVVAVIGGADISHEKIRERKRAYVFFKDPLGKTVFFEGAAAERFIADFGEAVPVLASEIRGVSAHTTGKIVRGKVAIINSDHIAPERVHRLIEQMEPGQILVSITTAPDLMGALKKAAAVITDVGGMLSHAAITARELCVPCIVGTQYASKILKDGDRVEVNADKGIIRIIT